jgi:hypothetical protein
MLSTFPIVFVVWKKARKQRVRGWFCFIFN